MEQRDFLAGFEETAVLPVDGLGDVLFFHATPRRDIEKRHSELLPIVAFFRLFPLKDWTKKPDCRRAYRLMIYDEVEDVGGLDPTGFALENGLAQALAVDDTVTD